MNHHWRPLDSLCSFCSLNYTWIAKMETFSRWHRGERNRCLKMRCFAATRLGSVGGWEFHWIGRHQAFTPMLARSSFILIVVILFTISSLAFISHSRPSGS